MARLKVRKLIVTSFIVGPIILAAAIANDVLNPRKVVSRRSSLELKITDGQKLITPHKTKAIKLAETDRYLVKELCNFPGIKSVALRQLYDGEFSPIAQCGPAEKQELEPIKKEALIQCVTKDDRMICPLVPTSSKIAVLQLEFGEGFNRDLIETRIQTLDISLALTNQGN